MALLSCTGCNRKHDRPINSRCSYMKLALVRCKELGVSPDNYRLHLPDLDVAASVLPAMASPSKQSFNLSPEDVKALLTDNAECKRQVQETNRQMGVLIQQMSELTFAISSDRAASNMAARGGVSAGTLPPRTDSTMVTTSTSITTSIAPVTVTSPIATSSPVVSSATHLG